MRRRGGGGPTRCRLPGQRLELRGQQDGHDPDFGVVRWHSLRGRHQPSSEIRSLQGRQVGSGERRRTRSRHPRRRPHLRLERPAPHRHHAGRRAPLLYQGRRGVDGRIPERLLGRHRHRHRDRWHRRPLPLRTRFHRRSHRSLHGGLRLHRSRELGRGRHHRRYLGGVRPRLRHRL